MINPGVIKLFSNEDSEIIGLRTRFEIEDNIGECIHIHYGSIRIDLSIDEFEQIVRKCRNIINDLVEVDAFSIDDFDSLFIAGNSANMPFLRKIEKSVCLLSELLIDTMNQDGTTTIDNLYNSRVYKAFIGDSLEDDGKKQINRFSNAVARYTNEERRTYHLNNVEKIVVDKAIVVNENNQICDGQHRAASLLRAKGDIKIPVRKLIYDDTIDIDNTCVVDTYGELMTLVNFCNVHNRIFLYGAGKYAKKLKILLELNDIDVQGFITTEDEKESYCCKSVICSEKYKELSEENDGIIVAFLAAEVTDIIKNLKIQEEDILKVDLHKVEKILKNIL